MKIRWTGFRTLHDYWGQAIPRYYNLDTLANAVEWTIKRKDPFIGPSVREVLGTPAVSQYTFDLFQESKYQVTFRMKASNEKRKEAMFAFVAAKQEGAVSKAARAEHTNLVTLHERAPKHVVQPFRGGVVFLPRHRGKAKEGRQIYAFVRQWLGQYHELGVNKNLQFFINIQHPQAFSREQTEGIKGRIIDVIARTYDPKSGDCMEIPQVTSGDFMVMKAKQGVPRIKLIACRRMVKRMTPAKILNRIAQNNWKWGREMFSLLPEQPGTVFTGLEAALGKELARVWITDYCRAVEGKTFPEPPTWPIEELKRFGY